MTRTDMIIDYLANHAARVEELARISWNEWRSIYEQKGKTFDDSLRKYRERLGQRPEVGGRRMTTDYGPRTTDRVKLRHAAGEGGTLNA